MLSITEENYLKAIFTLSYPTVDEISTNDIAKHLGINPASVSDMLKKLYQKKLIAYIKYQGVKLTEEGRKIAIDIVRKHRIWETFLVDKLNFTWDEVHEIAEQLEHIRSPLLIERLYQYLNSPEFDPHGEPIPDSNGFFPDSKMKNWIALNSCQKQQILEVRCIKDDSTDLLQFLDKKKIKIGSKIKYVDINNYDKSIEIQINESESITNISQKVAEKIYGVLLE
ncbi:MAG: metal-dependent transcriptional regulator [Raineya sp.]|nr:metal-dependent transcriptional regulator [Raineya sp.]